jgi:16S rRNA processing protein RimM
MLDVGRVVKPHGLRGEVIVELLTNRTERADAGTILHTDDGPMTITRSSRHQGRWIVQFEGVDTIDKANALRGTVLRAEPIEDPDALWVHELIGAQVVDTVGTDLGTVKAVEANPASDLLVLEGGGLIPLTFVAKTEPGRITVDPPPGLLD